MTRKGFQQPLQHLILTVHVNGLDEERYADYNPRSGILQASEGSLGVPLMVCSPNLSTKALFEEILQHCNITQLWGEDGSLVVVRGRIVELNYAS